MNRRSFLAIASSLIVPVSEPVRRYFFAPAGGWICEPSYGFSATVYDELMGRASREIAKLWDEFNAVYVDGIRFDPKMNGVRVIGSGRRS
jgi:hypothetical protein